MERDLRIAVFGQKRLSREGGVEIVVKELCTRMAQQGCQVTCYTGLLLCYEVCKMIRQGG